MARNFDGTGDHIAIADNAALDVGDVFTYGIWFRRTTSGVNYQTLFSKGDDTCVAVFGAAGGNLLEVYKANSGKIAFSTTSYTDTNWHQATIAKNGATSFKIYVDGADVTDTVTDRTCASNDTRSQRIGEDDSGNSPAGQEFQGDLAEFAIWNRTLSLAEAQGLADGFSPLFYQRGLNVYLPLHGNNSPERDLKSGLSATVTNATKAAHPRIIYPSNYNIAPFAAAAPGGNSYANWPDFQSQGFWSPRFN